MPQILPSQTRLPLYLTNQEHASTPASTMVSDQSIVKAASFTADKIDLDLFLVNTTDGSVVVQLLAGAKYHAGKVYKFQKTASANTMTVTALAGEFVEGAASVAVTDEHGMVAISWDPHGATWRRAFPVAPDADLDALTPDDIGAAAVDGANVSGADLTAWRTLLAADLKSDTHSFGPFALSLVGADADELRFQPKFACVITGVTAVQTKGTVTTGTAIATLTTTGGAPTDNTLTHVLADAAGAVRSMTPSGAACTVGASGFVRLAITGTNDGAGTKAGYTIQYTRT